MGRKPKEEAENAATPFERCEEAEQIVKDLVYEVHNHLQSVRIECHLVSREIYDRGVRQPVQAKKIAGLTGHLADFPSSGGFVLLLDGKAWLGMGKDLKKAVLDNALQSLKRSDNGRLSIKGPDVVVHPEVIKRRGLFTEDLKSFGRAVVAMQPALQLEEGGISESEAEEFVSEGKPKERREKAAAAAS